MDEKKHHIDNKLKPCNNDSHRFYNLICVEANRKLTLPDVSLHLSFVNRKLTARDFITVAPKVLSFSSVIIVKI